MIKKLDTNSYPCHTKYVFVDTSEVYNSKYGQIKLVSCNRGCSEVDLSLDPQIRPKNNTTDTLV